MPRPLKQAPKRGMSGFRGWGLGLRDQGLGFSFQSVGLGIRVLGFSRFPTMLQRSIRDSFLPGVGFKSFGKLVEDSG